MMIRWLGSYTQLTLHILSSSSSLSDSCPSIWLINSWLASSAASSCITKNMLDHIRFRSWGMWHCADGQVVHDILQDCSVFIFRVEQLKKNSTTGNKIGSHIGIAVDTGWLETVASQSPDVGGGPAFFPPKWLFFFYSRNLKMKIVQSFKTSPPTGAMT